MAGRALEQHDHGAFLEVSDPLRGARTVAPSGQIPSARVMHSRLPRPTTTLTRSRLAAAGHSGFQSREIELGPVGTGLRRREIQARSLQIQSERRGMYWESLEMHLDWPETHLEWLEMHLERLEIDFERIGMHLARPEMHLADRGRHLERLGRHLEALCGSPERLRCLAERGKSG